jgi:hypothetical protein
MKKLSFLVFTLFAIFASSCALTQYTALQRETVKDKKTIKGSYTLILFGNRYGDDLETIAILDRKGDEYTIEPYSPAYNYRVHTNQKGSTALQKAMDFVGKHESYKGARISTITDKQGRVFGYEVRPFYTDLRFRTPDVLDVDYMLKENKVKVFIKLKARVRKYFEGTDRQDD